jgi:hypothetical protein
VQSPLDGRHYLEVSPQQAAKVAGKNLQRLRRLRRMTAQAFGQQIGWQRSRTFARRWTWKRENGERPLPLVRAWRICRELGCSLEDILPTGNRAIVQPPATDLSSKAVAPRIKYLRDMGGLTGWELSERMGLQPNTAFGYGRNKRGTGLCAVLLAGGDPADGEQTRVKVPWKCERAGGR